MSKFGVDNEKPKWPWISGAITAALVIAGGITFPEEARLLLRSVASAVSSEKPGARTSRDHNPSMCNGVIVVNCTAQNNVPAQAVDTPKPVEMAQNKPEQSSPTPSISKPEEHGRLLPVSKNSKENPEKKNKPKQDDPDYFVTRKYQSIGPNDDLTSLSYGRRKTSEGLCVLKQYESCFMALKHGRDTIIREQQ
jgi:hypothetical protein